jgi:hypothetical protein
MTGEKASWGPGPWQNEPDKEQWQDEATGYACLIKRNHFGALCGYVGLPEGHPWHGEICDDGSIEVHGGLNYFDFCQEGPEGKTICHVPAPGEPEPLWWIGFDCAHAWDVSPGLEAMRSIHIPDSSYKTVAYVKAECARLAEQASSVAAAV